MSDDRFEKPNKNYSGVSLTFITFGCSLPLTSRVFLFFLFFVNRTVSIQSRRARCFVVPFFFFDFSLAPGEEELRRRISSR